MLSFLSKGRGVAADILAAQLRISGNEQLHLPEQHRARRRDVRRNALNQDLSKPRRKGPKDDGDAIGDVNAYRLSRYEQCYRR